MSTASHVLIPADDFLDQVLSALIVADVTNLKRLEAEVSLVTAPRSEARLARNRAVFAVLLEETARNLRLLRRIAGKQVSDLYHAC